MCKLVYKFVVTFCFRFTGKKLTPLFHDDPYDGIVRGTTCTVIPYKWKFLPISPPVLVGEIFYPQSFCPVLMIA